MIKIKNTNDSLCQKEYGVKGTLIKLLVGVLSCTATWKSVWWFLRKLEINLPQDLVIPLLGIQLKDVQPYHKDIRSTVFIGSIIHNSQNLEQPRCPSTRERKRKMQNIQTTKYYSAVKKMVSLNLQGNGWNQNKNILNGVTVGKDCSHIS